MTDSNALKKIINQLCRHADPKFECAFEFGTGISVELTSSALMLPMKTIYGILVSHDKYENCMLCSKKCPNRKAVYDPEFFYGLGYETRVYV